MDSAATDPDNGPGAFAVKDCALIAIATGRSALTLKELLEHLLATSLDTVYYHFWGGLLEPRFEEREFNNDFAGWARHGLHDGRLAERLAMIDPTAFSDLDQLRQQVVDVIEQRLDEDENLMWQRATQPFDFIRSQIVVFDTRRRLTQPEALGEELPHFSLSSVFYHFIDARRRVEDGRDDFRLWLAGLDGCYDPLCNELTAIDPYFSTLTELRAQLTDIFTRYFAETAA
jgi:hypothetical protein